MLTYADVQAGKRYIESLEALKNEFDKAQLLWQAQRERLERLDELSMATICIRFQSEGEELDEESKLSILPCFSYTDKQKKHAGEKKGEKKVPSDKEKKFEELLQKDPEEAYSLARQLILNDKQEEFANIKAVSEAQMLKARGQWTYLTNLVKAQAATAQRKREVAAAAAEARQGDSSAGAAGVAGGAAERCSDLLEVEQSEGGSEGGVLAGVGAEKKGEAAKGGGEEAAFTNMCPVCHLDVGAAEVVVLP